MYRFDANGREVTNLFGLWSEDDYEVETSNYRSPEIKTGQHTNGAATVFVRRAETGNWWNTGAKSVFRVRQELILNGIERIEEGIWASKHHTYRSFRVDE